MKSVADNKQQNIGDRAIKTRNERVSYILLIHSLHLIVFIVSRRILSFWCAGRIAHFRGNPAGNC